jgi:hypothetical protein
VSLERITSHFLIDAKDSSGRVFEVDYTVTPYREGVLCFTKVPCSERPCTCPEREAHERRTAQALR